jgi:phospholipid/cholesterol/gamma-HCH transport system substrate-binding protein
MMARSKQSARSFIAGLGTIVVLILIGIVALTANQGHLPGASGEVVKAAFRDVGQLAPGSEVRQNGQVVGQVSSIDLVNGMPVVTMQVHGGPPMYRDGYAGIWDQSSLAQKYVELRAGTPASGPLGTAVLPVGRTESTHDLVQLLDVFDPATRQALGGSLRALGGGLAGYGPGLHDFVATLPGDLTDATTITTSLVSPRADLPGLLRSSDQLAERFTGREQQIAELLHQTDETLRGLGVDSGAPLRATISTLPGSLRTVHAALDNALPPLTDLAASTGDLKSGAGALGHATPDVRGVFRDGRAPLDRIPDFSDDAKPAVDDLSHTFTDARPFTPKLANLLDSGAPILKTLGPYAQDMGTMFTDLKNVLRNHDGWEYRLRIMSGAPTAVSVAGKVIADSRDPYPAPGQATRIRDRNGGLIPGDRPLLPTAGGR